MKSFGGVLKMVGVALLSCLVITPRLTTLYLLATTWFVGALPGVYNAISGILNFLGIGVYGVLSLLIVLFLSVPIAKHAIKEMLPCVAKKYAQEHPDVDLSKVYVHELASVKVMLISAGLICLVLAFMVYFAKFGNLTDVASVVKPVISFPVKTLGLAWKDMTRLMYTVVPIYFVLYGIDYVLMSFGKVLMPSFG